MKPRPTLLPPIIAFALLGIQPAIEASASNDAYLAIDGKLRVHGAPLEGARVVVFHQGRESQVITNDVAQINMKLDLQSTYLLSFEREGCITKQLVFDTHVPAHALVDAPFGFPFKVTLEAMPANSAMQYVGPVGLISYDVVKADFDHDSKYSLVELDELLEATLPSAASVSPTVLRELLPRMNILPNSGASELEKSVRARAASLGAPIARGVEVMDELAAPHKEARIVVKPGFGSMTTASSKLMVDPSIDRTVPMRVVDKRTPPVAARISNDGRAEEVQVERLRVTTVVRITEAGRTNEYRRVAHRYGSVYFFRNGSSCSEGTYNTGITGR